jgi:hypothetical protein
VEIRGFDVVGRLRRKTAERRFRKEFPFRDVVRLPKKSIEYSVKPSQFI